MGLVHQPVEDPHVRCRLVERVLQPRPLRDQGFVRDLEGSLAGEEQATVVLGGEPCRQHPTRSVEISEVGGAPRRSAGFAEPHQPDEERGE